jgi:molybdopterin/thiamine biosynthesis adenylyltransferase
MQTSKSVISERYSRNLHALSAGDTDLLHSKKVCVIGCGGLGGYIIEILARIGIGSITAVDCDVFDVSNLNRQLFCQESLIGKSKAQAAADRVADINSEVNINALNVRFDEMSGEDLLNGHDIVMDALDNINTRRVLCRICAKLSIPLVHGSIAGWYGQVASIFPGDDTIDKIYPNLSKDKGIESTLGNLPFTASAVASLQCAECIKILTGRGSVLGKKLLRVDLLSCEFNEISLR